MRTRGASLRRRSDSSYEARDAVGAVRDAERGEGDAHGKTEDPTATSTESSEAGVDARAPLPRSFCWSTHARELNAHAHELKELKTVSVEHGRELKEVNHQLGEIRMSVDRIAEKIDQKVDRTEVDLKF
jgi:hypothetical protein